MCCVFVAAASFLFIVIAEALCDSFTQKSSLKYKVAMAEMLLRR